MIEFVYNENTKEFVRYKGLELKAENILSKSYYDVYYNNYIGSNLYSMILSQIYNFDAGMLKNEIVNSLLAFGITLASLEIKANEFDIEINFTIDKAYQDNAGFVKITY